MKLKIFGPNLNDQSKGQFVVHRDGCADCKKLEHQAHNMGVNAYVEEHDSTLSVSKSIWSDMIKEGSMTAEDGLSEIHFAPCVKFPKLPNVELSQAELQSIVGPQPSPCKEVMRNDNGWD